jgi:hypothetical protein
MATNHYFNNYGAKNEQRIIEDLIVESIKIMGFDAYYIPNDNDQARDLLFGEDPVKKFKTAFQLEFYLSSSLEYTGDREFFSKFGLEIKNNVNVIVSKRSFSQRVSQNSFHRPREGDLIYVPFLNGTGELYEIKFTDSTKDFFMLGRKVPYFYELELEKFKYSHEVISTGVPDIDQVAKDNAYSLSLHMSTGTGDYKSEEIAYQSADGTYANATTTAIVQSWDHLHKILRVSNITGEFNKLTSNTVYGSISNAHYLLTTFNPLDVELRTDHYDNLYIEDQGTSIIDFSESNPFGSL